MNKISFKLPRESKLLSEAPVPGFSALPWTSRLQWSHLQDLSSDLLVIPGPALGLTPSFRLGAFLAASWRDTTQAWGQLPIRSIWLLTIAPISSGLERTVGEPELREGVDTGSP